MSIFDLGRRRKSMKEMISRLTAEKEVLQHSEEANKQKIIELDDETKELKQAIQRLEFQNKELLGKIHTEEPYEKIYNERQDLKHNVSVKDSKIHELESERKELNETIENFKTEVKTIKSKHDDISSSLQRERDKHTEVCKDKDDLLAKVTELEKDKDDYEVEIIQLKEDFDKIRMEKEAWDRAKEDKTIVDKAINTEANAYIEEARQGISEYKNRAEDLQLACEALKSENESLFRANEAKAKEINEIQKDLTEIKQDLIKEQLRYNKLFQDWEEEKRGTEFVMVSKSARRRNKSRHGSLEATKEENDSEDEHILGLVESARAETEALRERERGYKKRISELQTDKAELFRSGSSIFMENKSLKARYDGILGERDRLLKSESSLKRKVREQDKEIADLKKTIDDMYYQNIAIKANDENERKRNAYVVVMGNEMVKTLEREKSALYRRVKYLEKENNEIESRVLELQRQSDTLIDYTHKFDRQADFSTMQGHRDGRDDIDRDRERQKDGYEFDQIPSQKALSFHNFDESPKLPSYRLRSQERRETSSSEKRPVQDIVEESRSTQYRNYSRNRDSAQIQKSRPYNDYKEDIQLRSQRTASRDPFTDDKQSSPSRTASRDIFSQAFDPFRPRAPRHAPTYETISTTGIKSQESGISLPRIDDRQSPRPRSHSSKGRNSRRTTPSLSRP